MIYEQYVFTSVPLKFWLLHKFKYEIFEYLNISIMIIIYFLNVNYVKLACSQMI